MGRDLFFFNSTYLFPLIAAMSLKNWLLSTEEKIQKKAADKAVARKKSRRQFGKWAKWPAEEKLRIGKLVRQKGVKHCQMYVKIPLIPPCFLSSYHSTYKVPRTTLLDWASASTSNQGVRPVGRPAVLSSEEEARGPFPVPILARGPCCHAS